MDFNNLSRGSRDSESYVVEDPYNLSFLRSDLRRRADQIVEEIRVIDGKTTDWRALAPVLAFRGRLDQKVQVVLEHLRDRERRRCEDVVLGFAIAAAREATVSAAEIDRLADVDSRCASAA